ncbi:MAG TPA: ATP-binding cassette domain-containing protein [Bacillales bacterium]|nr:ATP-binding cassette domain-containing protein [Bacillales bacterium]
MILCSTYQLTKTYGTAPVFDQLQLEIHEGDRIGLVGRNGSGKSTLFRVLAGMETADQGEVHVSKGSKVGYRDGKADGEGRY